MSFVTNSELNFKSRLRLYKHVIFFLSLYFFSIMKVAAISSMVAAIYMRIFLEETSNHFRSDDALNQPILGESSAECSQSGSNDSSKIVPQSFKKVLPLKDIFCLLRSR